MHTLYTIHTDVHVRVAMHAIYNTMYFQLVNDGKPNCITKVQSIFVPISVYLFFLLHYTVVILTSLRETLKSSLFIITTSYK